MKTYRLIPLLIHPKACLRDIRNRPSKINLARMSIFLDVTSFPLNHLNNPTLSIIHKDRVSSHTPLQWMLLKRLTDTGLCLSVTQSKIIFQEGNTQDAITADAAPAQRTLLGRWVISVQCCKEPVHFYPSLWLPGLDMLPESRFTQPECHRVQIEQPNTSCAEILTLVPFLKFSYRVLKGHGYETCLLTLWSTYEALCCPCWQGKLHDTDIPNCIPLKSKNPRHDSLLNIKIFFSLQKHVVWICTLTK